MTEEYKRYPYDHFSRGSKPKITVENIDTHVAQILDLINNTPDITDKQLEYIQNKIKDKIREKQKYYLASQNDKPVEKQTLVRFSESTKKGGKTRRRRYNHKKNKKFSQYSRHKKFI